MKTKYLIMVMALAALTVSCRSHEKYRAVDSSSRSTIPGSIDASSAGKPRLKVVISPIYSARESFAHYNDLIHYIALQCSLQEQITYCKDYRDAYQLFESGNADIGIVSPSVYVIAKRHHLMKLLAVPVIKGRCTCNALVIVPRNSSIHSFEDLKGKTFAFTDELSLAGYFFPVFRGGGNEHFWGETFVAGSHDYAIDLVNQGIVEGTSVSSYVLEALQKHDPQRTKNVRVIDSSMSFGMPPFVLRTGVSETVENALRKTLLTLNSNTLGATLLSSIDVKMFVSGSDSLYASACKMVPEDIIP